MDNDVETESVEVQTENVLSRLYKRYVQNVFLQHFSANSKQKSANFDIKSSYSSDKSRQSRDESSFSGINPIVNKHSDRASVIEL